ncbi:hypothetical protein SLA2020_288610 [Shorea laevis]
MLFIRWFQHGHGSRGSKIYVSGPSLNSSNNVDQMLRHDRNIQKFIDEHDLKIRVEKVHAHGRQVTANECLIFDPVGG